LGRHLGLSGYILVGFRVLACDVGDEIVIAGPASGRPRGAPRWLCWSSRWTRQAHPSPGSQPSEDRFSESRWDREADPGVSPALGNDHGIDADRLASPIDQRAAAVPRVDVRIRLDEAAVRLQFDLAIEGAHDADGGRLIEAKRGCRWP
jgi:hypothetical protein